MTRRSSTPFKAALMIVAVLSFQGLAPAASAYQIDLFVHADAVTDSFNQINGATSKSLDTGVVTGSFGSARAAAIVDLSSGKLGVLADSPDGTVADANARMFDTLHLSLTGLPSATITIGSGIEGSFDNPNYLARQGSGTFYQVELAHEDRTIGQIFFEFAFLGAELDTVSCGTFIN